jgi:hypothetical protein
MTLQAVPSSHVQRAPEGTGDEGAFLYWGRRWPYEGLPSWERITV